MPRQGPTTPARGYSPAVTYTVVSWSNPHEHKIARLALVLILAILPQAFLSKPALRVLPYVDLALPAFVGPGGGGEPDQRRESVHHSGICTVCPVVSSTRIGLG